MNYHFSIVELVVKRSRFTKGHHLNNVGSTKVSTLYIPSNKAGCWSKKMLNGFYNIWAWQPFGPCDPTHFLSPIPVPNS